MWDLKKNYKKKEEQPLCPLCELEEDTTDRKQRNIKNNTGEKWEEVVHIYIYREREREREKTKKKRKNFRKKFLDLVFLYSHEQWTFWR